MFAANWVLYSLILSSIITSTRSIKTQTKRVPSGEPSVRVCLVQSLRLPPSASAVATVRAEGRPLPSGQLVFAEVETRVALEDAIVAAGEDGH